MRKEYALYKGEECLAIGTVDQIAEKLNIKRKTIYFYSMPAYKKRCKGHNHKILINLDDN